MSILRVDKSHRGGVALGRGDVERGALVVVGDVGWRASRDQPPQQRQVALEHTRAQVRCHCHRFLAQPTDREHLTVLVWTD